MSENYSDKLYIGIDLGKETAMLSYFYQGMEKPATVSFVAGGGDYKLPLVIAKRRGIGYWVYGKEAVKMGEEGRGTAVDCLFERAMRDEVLKIEERDYPARELFLLYLKKITSIPNKLDYQRKTASLVIAVRQVTEPCICLLEKMREGLHLKKEQFEVIDYKESFYFYSCNQEESLQNHQVGLFDGTEEEITYLSLKKVQGTKPTVVQIGEKKLGSLSSENKDRDFQSLAGSALSKSLVCAVYFVGDVFDGGWMQESLRFICRGRRAFLGKNLYSLGACFASIQKKDAEWNYIYLGDSAFKINISLKVRKKQELEFYSLVTAGENWYHGSNSCEVILDETNTVELWLQHPYAREAKIESLELADLPERPSRTTRIRITAKLLSDVSVELELKDLGFGELFVSSGKTWRYRMDF